MADSPLPPAGSSPATAAPLLPVIPEDAARVLRGFRIVFNAVKSHFREIERRAHIGGAQLWALSVVAGTPGVGISALARAMDIEQSTASNLARALISQGLIETRKGALDRRTTCLHVLPAGQAVLARAPGPFTGVLPDALARLDGATLARLDQDLARLIAVLAADPRAAGKLLSDP